MARTGTNPVKKDEAAEEEPLVDFMAEAPPARPYNEAVTEQHRQLLADAGVPLPEASPAS